METCASCRFFDLHPSVLDLDRTGYCRRKPPTLTGRKNVEARPEYWTCGVWPETFASDWCGEWQSVQPHGESLTAREDGEGK